MLTYKDFCAMLDSAEGTPLEVYISTYRDLCPNMQRLVAIWSMGHDGLSIKSICATCHATQKQIAAECGISSATLTSWSSGKRVPPEWVLRMTAYSVLSNTQM